MPFKPSSCRARKAGMIVVGAAGAAGVWLLLKRLLAKKPEMSGGRRVVTGPGPSGDDSIVRHVEVGATEAAVLQLSRQRNGYMKVGLLLRIKSPNVKTEDVKATLKHLQRLHPVLRSVVVSTNDADPDSTQGLVLQEKDMDASPSSLDIPVTEHTNCTDESWRELWTSLEGKAYEFGAPLMSVELLRRTGGDATVTCDVLLVVEHAFTDGISVSALGHTFLEVLGTHMAGSATSEAPVSLPWPPTAEAATRASWPTPFHRWKLMLQFMGKMMFSKPAPRSFPAQVNATAYCPKTGAGGSTKLSYGSLSAEETTALVTRCREKGTTIGGALTAALMYAAAQSFPCEEGTTSMPLAVGLAVDPRRLYRPPMDSSALAFHVTGGPHVEQPAISTAASPSLDAVWATAVEARQTIASSLPWTPLFISPFLSLAWGGLLKAKTVAFTNPMAPSFTVSSWGRLPIQDSYSGGLSVEKVFPLVNLAYPGPFCGTLSWTANGRLSILVTNPAPLMDDQQPVVDRAVSILKSLSSA